MQCLRTWSAVEPSSQPSPLIGIVKLCPCCSRLDRGGCLGSEGRVPGLKLEETSHKTEIAGRAQLGTAPVSRAVLGSGTGPVSRKPSFRLGMLLVRPGCLSIALIPAGLGRICAPPACCRSFRLRRLGLSGRDHFCMQFGPKLLAAVIKVPQPSILVASSCHSCAPLCQQMTGPASTDFSGFCWRLLRSSSSIFL